MPCNPIPPNQTGELPSVGQTDSKCLAFPELSEASGKREWKIVETELDPERYIHFAHTDSTRPTINSYSQSDGMVRRYPYYYVSDDGQITVHQPKLISTQSPPVRTMSNAQQTGGGASTQSVQTRQKTEEQRRALEEKRAANIKKIEAREADAMKNYRPRSKPEAPARELTEIERRRAENIAAREAEQFKKEKQRMKAYEEKIQKRREAEETKQNEIEEYNRTAKDRFQKQRDEIEQERQNYLARMRTVIAQTQPATTMSPREQEEQTARLLAEKKALISNILKRHLAELPLIRLERVTGEFADVREQVQENRRELNEIATLVAQVQLQTPVHKRAEEYIQRETHALVPKETADRLETIRNSAIAISNNPSHKVRLVCAILFLVVCLFPILMFGCFVLTMFTSTPTTSSSQAVNAFDMREFASSEAGRYVQGTTDGLSEMVEIFAYTINHGSDAEVSAVMSGLYRTLKGPIGTMGEVGSAIDGNNFWSMMGEVYEGIENGSMTDDEARKLAVAMYEGVNCVQFDPDSQLFGIQPTCAAPARVVSKAVEQVNTTVALASGPGTNDQAGMTVLAAGAALLAFADILVRLGAFFGKPKKSTKISKKHGKGKRRKM